MKLYRFNFRMEIMECEIVKETKRTYIYHLPYSEVNFTILKKDLDAPNGITPRNIVATSREKLIEVGVLVANDNIAFHKKQMEKLQEEKNNILKLSNQ